MEGLYRLAKMVVEKKYSGNNEYKYFFIAALYGMLCKYKNYAELVCDLFLKTDIYMDKKPVSEILKEHDIEIEFEDLDTENNKVYAVADSGDLFVYDEESDSIVYKKTNPFIACSIKREEITNLLNSFCHEFNHIVKGAINGHSIHTIGKDYEYYLRSGLAHYVYLYKDKADTITEMQRFSYLDEAINCLQTTEIMKNIINLKDVTNDLEMLEFLDVLDENEASVDHGYEDIVNNVRELWEIDDVKKVIEEGLVNGDMEHIINKFNRLSGDDNGFWKMSNIIDNLSSEYYDEERTDFYKNREKRKLNKIIQKIKNNKKNN